LWVSLECHTFSILSVILVLHFDKSLFLTGIVFVTSTRIIFLNIYCLSCLNSFKVKSCLSRLNCRFVWMTWLDRLMLLVARLTRRLLLRVLFWTQRWHVFTGNWIGSKHWRLLLCMNFLSRRASSFNSLKLRICRQPWRNRRRHRWRLNISWFITIL